MQINQQYYYKLENIYHTLYVSRLDKWSDEQQMRIVPRYVYKYLEKNYKSISNIRLLDVGCGKGHDAHFFALNNIQVVGIDPCEHNTWSTYKLNNLNFIQSSVFNFLQSMQYDVIFDNGCSHHFDPNDYKYFLQQVAKNLTVGGVFCTNVFCSERTHIITDNNGRYNIIFSQQDLIEILINNGFKMVYTKYLKRKKHSSGYLFGIFKYINH